MNRKLKLEELERPAIEAYKKMEKIPLTIVLDNVRSLNNIGSFFRTADAFNIQEIILCGITAIPPHKDIHKTALGSTESVAWKYIESTLEAVSALQKQGVTTFAIEQTEKSQKLHGFEAQKAGAMAVVFGNEVFGVDQKVIDACTASLEIPQVGTKHSLNVSVCAGIVMWEIAKQLDYFPSQSQPVLS